MLIVIERFPLKHLIKSKARWINLFAIKIEHVHCIYRYVATTETGTFRNVQASTWCFQDSKMKKWMPRIKCQFEMVAAESKWLWKDNFADAYACWENSCFSVEKSFFQLSHSLMGAMLVVYYYIVIIYCRYIFFRGKSVFSASHTELGWNVRPTGNVPHQDGYKWNDLCVNLC